MGKIKHCLQFTAIAGILAWSACSEIGPEINFFEDKAQDTTYMLEQVPSAQARKVLVEEFTGASCTNCPRGHEVLENLKSTYGERMVTIAYHKFGTTLDWPAYWGKPDFLDTLKYDYRREEATKIATEVYGDGVPSIPMAGVDRIYNSSKKLQFNRTEWAAKIAERMEIDAPANIDVDLTMNEDKSELQADITITYTQAVTSPQHLNVMLTESGMDAPQKYPDSTASHYIHNSVFRKMYTSPTVGKNILSGIDIQPGRVYKTSMVLPMDTLWDLKNCKLIVFVSNNAAEDKTIVQAASYKVLE
jgi:hypothetical protein